MLDCLVPRGVEWLSVSYHPLRMSILNSEYRAEGATTIGSTVERLAVGFRAGGVFQEC